MCSICVNSTDFVLFSMIWYCRVQSPAVSQRKMYDDVVFAHRFSYALTMFGNRELIGLSRLLHAHIAYEKIQPKSSTNIVEFPTVCMIWYGWIQSSAMFKQKDVRWYIFRWSIAISIDYVWSRCIDRAISTPRFSFCIWNSYIKNHHCYLAWCGKRSLMQDCSEILV